MSDAVRNCLYRCKLFTDSAEGKEMGAKEFLKKIPVPICGLSLGLASLDRFLWYNHNGVYVFNIFALFAFLIAGLFTVRIFVDAKGIVKDIQNPGTFGVLATYTMTLMLLSAFVKDHIGGIAGDAAFVIWAGAIVVSYVFMAFFIRNAFLKFSMEKVLPSWVIIFVGYVVASVTSPSFGTENIGRMIFWSGLIGYLLLLPLISYRTLIVRKIPEAMVPQTAIFAAPVNLCIVGCLTVYGDAPPEIALAVLTVLGVISYAAVIGYLPVMLNRRFYPSFAALTFPLVISAASFHYLGAYYGVASDPVFGVLQTATVIIAVAVVVYVLIRYIMFLYQAARSAPA